MNVAITGASGMLGSAIAQVLAADHSVVGLSRRPMPASEHMAFQQIDYTTEAAVRSGVAAAAPDVIVHCAAIVDVDFCEQHEAEALHLHRAVTGWLADECQRRGAYFMYISTDSVFDGTASRPYVETDAARPLNVYARSKFAGEEAALRSRDAIVLRTNIIGRSTTEKPSLADWLLQRFDAGQTVKGFDDVVFTPVHVHGIGESVRALMHTRPTGLFHLASSDARSKFQFARALAEAAGFDPALVLQARIDDVPLTAPRPKYCALNCGKATDAFRWSAPTVNDVIQSYLDHRRTADAARQTKDSPS